MNYRPEVDGLRALAVIPVIFYHANYPFFGGGYLGVDIFFVISGYLITKILYHDFDNKKFSFLTFLYKRIKRLLPALLFVLLIVVTVSYFILSPSDYIKISKSALTSLFFISNIYYWSESNYFNQINEFSDGGATYNTKTVIVASSGGKTTKEILNELNEISQECEKNSIIFIPIGKNDLKNGKEKILQELNSITKN